MKGLTKRQSDILTFIQNFIEVNRYSPSYSEIKTHFEFKSTNGVSKHLKTLKQKGLLQSEPNCSRSITLTQPPAPKKITSDVEIPFIGTVKAGFPIETFTQFQTIAVPAFMVHSFENSYVLRVSGTDFQEEMIRNDDLLIVETRKNPNNGETVIALINDHDTVIMKYYLEGPYIRLANHNPHHQPMILRHEDVTIQGVVVAMLRLYNNN
jgi:repressor LexA